MLSNSISDYDDHVNNESSDDCHYIWTSQWITPQEIYDQQLKIKAIIIDDMIHPVDEMFDLSAYPGMIEAKVDGNYMQFPHNEEIAVLKEF